MLINKYIKFISLFLVGVFIGYIIFISIFSQLPDPFTSWFFDSTAVSIIVYIWLFVGIPGLLAHYFTFRTIQSSELVVVNNSEKPSLKPSILMSIIMGIVVLVILKSLTKPHFYPYTLHSIDSDELTDPAEFKVKDVQILALSENFHKKSQEIFDDDLESMSCVKSGIPNWTDEKIRLLFPNPHIINYIKQVQNYRFSGNVREITFDTLCIVEKRYLTLFSSNGDDVHIGGGGYPPLSFAYTDNENKLVVVENTNNCLDIIGSTKDFIYLKCGYYGDGPSGWETISKIKIGDTKLTNVVKCESNINTMGTVRTQKCYNSKNILYYSKSFR